MTEHSLGRMEPTDFEHVDKWQARALRTFAETVDRAERVLPLPSRYRSKYDQGAEGACVGFSESWMQSIYNKRFYDAFWLYRNAQLIDEWQGEDYDGTSVRAGFDVLRTLGHLEIHNPKHRHVPELRHGIDANRWLLSVDEMRTAVQNGNPIVMGTNWYQVFDKPEERAGSFGKKEFFIPNTTNLGRIRGGHAWCIYGVSDKRQAFKMTNSWGLDYELTWFPYDVVARLLREYGEAGIVTDR